MVLKFLDHCYQQVIQVSLINKQNSGKVVTEVPHLLHKYVEVVPKESLVLAHTKAEFCVKFHPKYRKIICFLKVKVAH